LDENDWNFYPENGILKTYFHPIEGHFPVLIELKKKLELLRPRLDAARGFL
jgi:hypothetical protein